MQAIKAYYDEGKLIPFEPIRIPNGSHVIITILDYSINNKDDILNSWFQRLHKARTDSMDEKMIYIPRSKEMRPPINLNGEL